MKLLVKNVLIQRLATELKSALSQGMRIGHLTSKDGGQLLLVLLDSATGSAELWISEILHNSYSALTLHFPQVHWLERMLWDMFGIVPLDHPRLKPVMLHERPQDSCYPLRQRPMSEGDIDFKETDFQFLNVIGDGVWELPVGPIHAGIIEPGHFRLSCLGETILNLEISLGYVHRGVEKRLTDVPWQKARFVVEACASDTAVANALAHAIAIENLLQVEVPHNAQLLRSIALELERVCMHIIDLGGMATDIGMIGVAASMGRFRGRALALAQAVSGSRFMRGYILPGGVSREPSSQQLQVLQDGVPKLRESLKPVMEIFEHKQPAIDRFEDIGKVKKSLAADFGLVGVAGRACGIAYDTRQFFAQGVFPEHAPPTVVHNGGDIRARTMVRIQELWHSLDCIEELVALVTPGPVQIKLPETLPPDTCAIGITEAFRGELVHLIMTGESGKIQRYAIKDPSINNWTGVSIGVRNNLIADFPLVNKSNSLSYSGNDL